MADEVDLDAVTAVAQEAFGKQPEPAPIAEPVVEPAAQEAAETVVEPAVKADKPAEPVVEPTAEPAPHPAWEQALSRIPEVFRPALLEQIRVSERESQAAIERARSDAKAIEDAVPQEWRDFISKAAPSIGPADVVASLQAAQAIRQDPVAFLEAMQQQVSVAVKAGHLTVPQGKEAILGAMQQVQAAQQANDDTLDLLTPDESRIAKLEQQLTAMQQAEANRISVQQQMENDQRQEAAAAAYAGNFIAKLGELNPTATQQQQQTIGYLADALIQRSGNQISVEQAIGLARRELESQGMVFAGAPVAVPAVAAPALAPATSAIPAPEKISFKSENERENAMRLALEAALAQG